MCHTRFFMALCILGYSARLWRGCEWRILQLPKWRSWLGESCLSHHLLTKFRTGQSEPWLILSDRPQDNRTGDNCPSHHLLTKFRTGQSEPWLILSDQPQDNRTGDNCPSHHLLTKFRTGQSEPWLILSDRPQDNWTGDNCLSHHFLTKFRTGQSELWLYQTGHRTTESATCPPGDILLGISPGRDIYYRKCSVSGPGYWRTRRPRSFSTAWTTFVRHACSWSCLRRGTGDRRTEYIGGWREAL